MALIDDVRLSLRNPPIALNDEITDLISAATLDLEISGVVNVDEADPLIKRAIVLYCKANFGMSNPDMERFQSCYDMLKNHLAISLDYTVEVV